jgi:hypothetical protein
MKAGEHPYSCSKHGYADWASLLSQAGIPKLRQSAKHKLRFKGKGHEVCSPTRSKEGVPADHMLL